MALGVKFAWSMKRICTRSSICSIHRQLRGKTWMNNERQKLFMSIIPIHFKERVEETINSIFSFHKLLSIILFFWIGISAVEAQEYATDRLFMKEFSKTKCRSAAEVKINNLKNKRILTLDQESFLNRNVWSKLRTQLPLSPGEKKHLRKLKQRGVSKNKLSLKDIKAKNASRFRALRLRCK